MAVGTLPTRPVHTEPAELASARSADTENPPSDRDWTASTKTSTASQRPFDASKCGRDRGDAAVDVANCSDGVVQCRSSSIHDFIDGAEGLHCRRTNVHDCEQSNQGADDCAKAKCGQACDRSDPEPLAGKSLRHLAVRVQGGPAALVRAAARNAERNTAKKNENGQDNPRGGDADVAHCEVLHNGYDGGHGASTVAAEKIVKGKEKSDSVKDLVSAG
eukprot:scaffold4549_cov136-Isochrysis_galbana.AAC.4